MSDPLLTSFLARLDATPDDPAALRRALVQIVAAARERFPDVAFVEADIGAWLGERVAGEDDPAAALGRLRGVELCLVCACLAGDARALHWFEAAYLAPVGERLARSGLAGDVVADARQRVAQNLLVAGATGPARLATYSGRGELAGWLYVAVAREARRLAGRDARLAPADDLELVDDRPGGDVELAHLKATYGEAFRAAFAAALAELGSESRTLLRQHILDGLSIDQLAALQRVHRATAARRLARVREDLALRTRALLVARLGLAEGESDSVLRLIRSQLDLSLSRLLG